MANIFSRMVDKAIEPRILRRLQEQDWFKQTFYDYPMGISGSHKEPLTVNLVNSDLVHIIISTITQGILSGRLVVNDNDELLTEHRILELFSDCVITTSLFWNHLIADLIIYGNAYLFLQRRTDRDTGDVEAIYPLNAKYMSVQVIDGIPHYRYHPSRGTAGKDYQPHELLHLKYQLHRETVHIGVTPMIYAQGELLLDVTARRFQNDVFAQGGYTGIMFNLRDNDGNDANPQQMMQEGEALIKRWRGKKSGEPFFAVGNWSATELLPAMGDKLDMRSIRYIPEERVCALYRVPTDIAGLGAGTERIGATATIVETHKQFFSDCIIPFARNICEQLTYVLLRLYEDDPNVYLEFDFGDVEALKEALNDKATRLQGAYDAGLITDAEYRLEMGWPETPEVGEFKDDKEAARQEEMQQNAVDNGSDNAIMDEESFGTEPGDQSFSDTQT